MRKLLFILLALAGCLLFSEGREGLRTVRTAPVAELSVCNVSAAQWQCERICNSDLNQPRVFRETEASPAAPMFLRGSLHTAVRAALRCVASCGGTGVAKLISTYRSNDLSVGQHAVDYYVYRLRRLII